MPTKRTTQQVYDG